MMCLEVASVCICLLLINPIILQNVSAKLSVGASNQPIKLHQQETNAAKKIIIPDGAADQNVEYYYQPKEVTISNDTSVTWVNQDSALHTATADKGSFDTGIIPIDGNATVIITGSGKLEYHCTIHPWMQGTIRVVSSSGYSSSQKNQLQHPRPLEKSTTLTPYLLTTHKTLKLLPPSLATDYGTEPEYKNDWITVNHDIFGTRSSNQTIIGKDNVNKLQFKWILLNKSPIEDPPIIIGDRGYVQDNGGNIVAFDTNTGHTLWKIHQGIGRYFHGLTYDHGVLFSGTGYNSTVIAVNATNGGIIWQSPVLGPSKAGYGVATPPIIWKDYVVVGSAGGDFPHDQSWQKGVVRGNITALNRTNGDIIWNFRTTTGEWVSPGKSPPNGGATAWSGGSFDPQSKILYMPLGNPAPDFNASTRLTPNLYANHMVAVNITNGKLVWAVPFVAEGTVLKVRLPDTHDWDTSWGSSVSNVTYGNGTYTKVVIGHDKMGNLIAMDAATGKELWWKTMGSDYHTDTIPLPKGSGPVWTYGIDAYHAVDNHNTLYLTTNGRGLNFFTNGISGHRTPLTKNSIGLGYQNGTIAALDMRTGMIKWNYPVDFPPLVSPLVTQGLVFSGYIPFIETAKSSHIGHPISLHQQIRTGVMLALDSDTGKEMWTAAVKGPIGVGGASVGDGMLFVPTGKVQSYKGVGGSIVAFALP